RTRDGHFPVDIERCAVPEVHQPGAGDGKVSVYVRGYVFVDAQSTAAAEIQISVDVKRGVRVKAARTRAHDGRIAPGVGDRGSVKAGVVAAARRRLLADVECHVVKKGVGAASESQILVHAKNAVGSGHLPRPADVHVAGNPKPRAGNVRIPAGPV